MVTSPGTRPATGLGPGPELALTKVLLQVEPGGSVQTTVRVTHLGSLVESYALDVVGLADGWWDVHPPELRLLPGTSGEAVVELHPPAGAPAPEAAVPFGVRAVSTLDGERSVVEEGDLEVGRVLQLQPAIVPVTSRARWTGRHAVTYTNWGNTAVQLVVSAQDKDQQLAFLVEPETVTVPVAGSATVRVRARIRRPTLRGARTRLPFQVVARRTDAQRAAPVGTGAALLAAGMLVSEPDRPVLDAAVDQRPVLTRGVVAALVALLVVAGLVAGWLVRASAVAGATLDDVAPGPPEGVRVAGFADEKALVAWTPEDGTVNAVAVVKESERPELVGADRWKPAPEGAPGLSVPIEAYTPDTEYCFSVKPFRSGRPGPPSRNECARTAPAGLVPPSDVQAVRQPAADQVKLQWTTTPGVAYRVQSASAEGVPDNRVRQDRTVGFAVVDAGTGPACFVVKALRAKDKRESDPSAPQCVDAVAPTPTGGSGQQPSRPPGVVTPGPPGSSSAPAPSRGGGTSPSTGATSPPTATRGLPPFIAVLYSGVVDGGNERQVRQQARKRFEDLRRSLPDAALRRIDRGTYGPTTFAKVAWLIYLDGGSSLEQAERTCQQAERELPGQTCSPLDVGGRP